MNLKIIKKKKIPIKSGGMLTIGLMMMVLSGCMGSEKISKEVQRQISEDPIQGALESVDPIGRQIEGVNVVFQKRYEVTARVLGVEKYSKLRSEGRISDRDWILSWGWMRDPEKVKATGANFRQSGRFYYFKVPQESAQWIDSIARYSANTHIVADKSWVKKDIEKVKAGDVIKIKGFLINAYDSSGWAWTSSLSREDRGAGACEILWVDSIDWLR